MICKTQGIPLRIAPFSRTSNTVTWLTPTHGRVITIAKGAQRRKSMFLGQFDLFYTCEVLFYVRERSPVYIVRECAPLKTRDRFRQDWRATGCASWLCDLVAALIPVRAHHPQLFDFLEEALDSLAAEGAALSVLPWSRLRLSRLLGVPPRLSQCSGCGASMTDVRERVAFQVSRGGVLCRPCAHQHGGDSIGMAPDVLALLQSWQHCDRLDAARRVVCSQRQFRETEAVLRPFLRFHLEHESRADRIAADLLLRATA